MPRKVLDQEMQELHAQIMHTGSLVEETLAKALASLETGDQTALHELVTVGTDLNRLSAAIEKQAIRLLILQQPLGGKDLRYLTAQKGLPAEVDDGSTEEPLHITEKVILRGLLDLGREALHMLQEAMRAFDRTDSKVARDVEEEWEYLELRHQRVSQDLMSVLARTYSTIPAVQSGLYMLQNATQLF